jgi:hypothetical protein
MFIYSPFVMPGLDPGIYLKESFAMDCRIKSGNDDGGWCSMLPNRRKRAA